MIEDRAFTLTVHGLSVDNGAVRADVFVEKLKALIESVRIADTHLNGRKSHHLLVTNLATASAHATLQERVSVKRTVLQAVPYVGEVLASVYAGDQTIDRYPSGLIEALSPLAKDVNKRFSHAEIAFARDNIIRVDDFFARQMDRALRRIEGDDLDEPTAFQGVTYSTFDGVVMEMDARGTMVRGKLVLTAGAREIDCVFSKADIPELKQAFSVRARVNAVAHFDGTSKLPVRLDVKQIQPLKPGPSLSVWRGSLSKRRAPQPEGL